MRGDQTFLGPSPSWKEVWKELEEDEPKKPPDGGWPPPGFLGLSISRGSLRLLFVSRTGETVPQEVGPGAVRILAGVLLWLASWFS